MPVTGAPDYTDNSFDAGDGYYLVTYGSDPAPKGPYTTIPEMAQANDLHSYPDDGYVVWVENGGATNVPSLNPDELVQTYRLEVRWDFTGTKDAAYVEAHRVAGKLDGGEVTDVLDEEWNEV